MGCTSSAPNVPEPQISTADTTDKKGSPKDSEEQIKENIMYCKNKDFAHGQGLPEDGTKTNHTKLGSDDNTFVADISNVDNKGIQINSVEDHHTVEIAELSPVEETFVSLKDVVEKAILENAIEDEYLSNVEESENMELDRQIEEIIMESNKGNDEKEIGFDEDEAKELSSPTQSEDSRATRWEALADIAAELPPSLAVDPLTGQIYSLTK